MATGIESMTFDQWFKWYCEKNMSCINHRRDFRACWNASKQESKFVMIETNVPLIKNHSENDDFE